MVLDNSYATDSKSIANLFKNFFCGVYSENNLLIDTTLPDLPLDSQPINIDISFNDILNSIKKSKLSFVPGTDGIPSAFIKNTSDNIVVPLYILFSKSLTEGKSHLLWKNSTITPIHKTGSRCDIKNYRPITNINSIPSLLDDIVANKLVSLCYDKISPFQHGFVKSRSTVSNLILHTHKIVDAIKKHQQYDTIYTDFKKAFDLVNHSILLHKLINLHIPSYIIKWLEDYLNYRYSSVKIYNCFSDSFKVPCGVPQGSHLGPILFILFINDLVNEVKFANCLLFADDCKISLLINSIEDCHKLQDDLSRISDWCKHNCMILSIKKCSIISFSRSHNIINFDYKIDNQSLSRLTTIKDLGVTFDSRLTFKPHLDNIIRRSMRNWYFICRHTKEFKDAKSIKTLYLSLVRSILTYASTIWRPIFKFDTYRLERVQHKALRKIAFIDGTPMSRFSHDYSNVATKFNIPSLSSFYEGFDSVFVYKIMSNNLSNNFLKSLLPLNVATYPTRFFHPFYPPLIKNVFSMKDPIFRLCTLGNQIALNKPFLITWKVSNNVASNVICSYIHNYC